MDAAFTPHPFPGHTTTELTELVARWTGDHAKAETVAKMKAELVRRERVAAGDWSVMSAGERLRSVREMEAKKARERA